MSLRAIRPSLRWLLLGVLLLCAVAIVWRPSSTSVEVIREREQKEVPAQSRPRPAPAARLSPLSLSPPGFDPFLGVVSSTAAGVAAQAPVLVHSGNGPLVGPEQPAPPPALTYRYLGRLVNPEGTPTVYLSQGAKEVPVSKNTVLEDGYVVEALLPAAIVILHVASQTRVSLPIPGVPPDLP